MIETGSLPQYQNSVHRILIDIDSPLSGFELHLMETGSGAGAFKTANLVTFSGQEGYLFDQSGNFFGGYQSGSPFELSVFYDHSNRTFSYYHDNKFIANSLDVTGASVLDTGNVNFIMFDKHGDSSVSVVSSGTIG
tara:strand:+ start:7695 stop:8102 length:408 start_codon:yes stop_codon:yes gene_type:complete